MWRVMSIAVFDNTNNKSKPLLLVVTLDTIKAKLFFEKVVN